MKHSKAFSLIELSIVILVIGILIAGVTQASNMIYEFKLAAAKNLTKSSGIESIKEMTLWLDATRANSNSSLINRSGKTDIQNNDPIKTWNNANTRRSGNAPSFINAAATNDPLYIKNGLNGLPTIKFDGINNHLAGVTSFGEIFKNNELTMFFVLIMKGPFNEGTLRFVTMAANTDSSRINLYFGTYSNILTLAVTYYGIDTNTVDNSFKMSSNIDKVPILISIRLKTDGTLSAKSNGKSLNPFAQRKISSPLDLGKTFPITIGWYNDNQSTNPEFYLSEMIFYNSGLKNEEILYVEKYLSKKWGIALQ